jgi:glutathione S-transferase
MAELILHHFDLSPFAEKARLMLGLKGLAWRSVEIPMIMPKPDLTALTGGYRKTPVLQVGADIYCDTRLIALELERRHPQPTLFPAGSRGLARMLAVWSDRAFFEPGAGLAMGMNRQGLPQAVIEDRKRFFNFMDFDSLEAHLPHLAVQFHAQAALVEEQLEDGRRYLLGDLPGLADIHAYFPVWMARGHVPNAEVLLAPFARLAEWERRMQSIGHGQRRPMSASEAHAAARSAHPAAEDDRGGLANGEVRGLALGEAVSVTPDDYGCDPVVGTLVRLTDERVTIERSDERIGTVHVHFPRIGYRIERCAQA